MTVDVTTLALAVDSSQVNTAATALDRMAAAGTRAEGASASFQRTSSGQARTLATTGQAASKTALSFRTLEEAQAALGPKAAAALEKVAGDLGATQAKADSAAAALRNVGTEAQAAGNKAHAALAAAADTASATATAAATAAASGGSGVRPPVPPRPLPAALPPAPQPPAAPAPSPQASQAAGASTVATAAAEKTAAASAAAAAGVEKLRAAEQALALADAKVAASQAALTSAVARNAQAQQQLATVSANSASSADQIAQAHARAASSNAALLSAQAGLTANQQAAAKAAKTHQDALAGLGKQAGLTAFQQQQIGFQLHDFAVQVISGQSPLTAFVQQGSQLSGTFGGAGNAFRAVTSLITPMRLAMAGAAAGVAALALAMVHAESAARDLASIQTQLAGTGRADLFSTKELKDYIAELAQLPGVTHDAAVGIVSELARSHDIGGAQLKDLGRLVADYAAATGQKIPDATKELTRALAEPEKGARDLDKALNGAFSSKQLSAIDDLTRLGKTAQAQAIEIDAVRDRVQGLARNGMTPLAASIDDLSKAWGRAGKALGESEGLATLNRGLAWTIDLVTWLIDHLPKIGAAIPSFKPGALAAEGIRLDNLDGSRAASPGAASPGAARAIAGPPAELAGAKSANVVSANAAKAASEAEIKGALKATEGYKSQAQQIGELVDVRKRLTAAIKESASVNGKDSDVTKDLRGRLAGVNERIAQIGKRGQGGKGNEAQQTLDQQLEGQIKAARDALAAERDAMAFSQRFLQGAYQAGELALRDFYEQKRKAIEEGTAAQVAELETERTKVQAHLEKTRKISPKDTSKLEQDQNRIAEIDRDIEKARLAGQREVVLATQEETGATRQLNEQILTYQANLKQLQGDEAGAAKIRTQIAIEQAKVLAKQSAKEGNPITAADQAATERALTQTNDIATARTRLGVVTQSLAIDEQRISMLQSTGTIGELEALDRLGAARAARLGQLQKEVDELEKLAKARPLDLQLTLDASRARLELDTLKAQIDPLKQKFDGIFKDAGANLFGDLMNGTKPRDALRNFANSISREINGIVGRQLSEQVFGDGGLFGGLGKAAADVFGSKKRGVSLDTSSAEQSLTSLRTTGVEPATNALTTLTEAAQTTAVALRDIKGTPLPPAASGSGATGDFARYDRSLDGAGAGAPPVADGSGAAGDFARFDRAQEKATESTNVGAKADQNAARAVTQLAQAAATGGSALNSLPAILQSISSAGGYGNPGGLIGAGLNYLFGGAGSAAADFGTGAAFGSQDLGLFFSKGGYTGDVPKDKVAGMVHGREYVFNAAAVDSIGLATLERMHKQAAAGDAEGVATTAVSRLRGARELGGPVSAGSLYRVNERGPEVLEIGGAQYLMTGSKDGEVKPAGTGSASVGDTFHLHISVPPGSTSATAAQLGSSALQGATREARRLGKRV